MHSFFSISDTRNFEKKIAELGVSLYPKVRIVRDLGLERFLLLGSIRNAQVRRPHPIPKKIKTVPIGARGRKRGTLLLSIGLTPNLDGRPVLQQPPANIQAPVRQIQAPSTANVATQRVPAKRTYGRVTSTPFANRPAVVYRPRFLSFPLPDESDESTVQYITAEDTSLNIDPDESFGRLQYDKSDSE